MVTTNVAMAIAVEPNKYVAKMCFKVDFFLSCRKSSMKVSFFSCAKPLLFSSEEPTDLCQGGGEEKSSGGQPVAKV